MQDLLDRAMNLAQIRGAQYADARVIEKETETLVLQNGEMRTLESAKNLGVGVRVLVDGAWGFASSRDLSLSEIDPFTISLDQKASVLVETDQALASVPEIKARTSNLVFIKERKWFANSDGARTDQTIIETGGGMTAYAVGEGEVQQRSYPSSWGRQQVTAGWETAVGWDLPGNAERVAGEAVALLTPDPCPSGRGDIILSGEQVALQIHESCGHPIELDRVYGTEAAYAGTSFLTTENWVGARSGMASTNGLDEASLKELANKVVEIVAISPEGEAIPTLTQPTGLTGVASVDPAAIDQSPEAARAEAVRQVCEAAAESGHAAYGAYLIDE